MQAKFAPLSRAFIAPGGRASCAMLCLGLVFLSGNVSAHSAMFPDNYQYDNSNEGLAKTANPTLKVKRAKQSSKAALVTCDDGLAGDYPCRNIDLEALLEPHEMGGGTAGLNDIWGWTDLATGREFALVGRNNGTSFVEVTDGANPQYIGFLPSHNDGVDGWRDIKVYQDHAFIVADGRGNATHGLQVFDLTALPSAQPGITFSETAHLDDFGAAHNIAINESSGYAYVTGAPSVCSGGLFMVDISTPAQPNFVGCFSGDGYTHDAQCVTYRGPDADYFGKEICVAFNEDTVTVVDVSDKSNPQMLSRTGYNGVQYTHQGWFLNDNHVYMLMNDEGDEQNQALNTTTYLWDLTDLRAPLEIGRYEGPTSAIDHNLYTRDDLVYESNYRAGLRILDAANIANGQLQERAYFDTIPCSNSAQFSGTWSSYVGFSSGKIITSDIGTGLFVLRPDQQAIASNANNVAVKTSPACAPTTPNPPTQPPAPGGSSGGGGYISWWVLLVLLGARLTHRRRLLLVRTRN